MEIKTLISLYIDNQLRRKEFIANRNHPVVTAPDSEILNAAQTLCAQLEREVRFSDVLMSFRKFGINKESFTTVLEQLSVGEINWMRIISVIALSGALAVECIEKGEEHKVDLIEDLASSFAEMKFSNWIETNGGLKGLVDYSRQSTPQSEPKDSHWERKLIAAGTIGVIVGLFVASKA